MEENKDKLKPCPFCGNENVKVSSRYSEHTGEIYWYKVECFCGCFATVVNSERNIAIRNWNRRYIKQ